jgi:murein DD-endopeptidase MepM/ murein hydrolase activator NlpD
MKYLIFLLLLLLSIPSFADAQSLNEVKSKIEEHNDKIKQIEEEIERYEKELREVAQEKNTLQGAIKSLDVTRTTTESRIKSTQNKIDAALLELKKLEYEIFDAEQVIQIHKATLAQSIRNRHDADEVSFVERMVLIDSMTDMWELVDQRQAVEEALTKNISSLISTKNLLGEKIESVDTTKDKLSTQKVELSTQKKALDVARTEKQVLLSQTQSEEAQYQALIATKKAEQKAFESELNSLEDALAQIIDPSRLPTVGAGVLSWPFSATYMANCSKLQKALGNSVCVTQYFGNTPFATKNPQVYSGAGHSGVDFSAPVGTPLVSVLSGVVTDTGNTDAIRGCYSFGKWVVVKHANGVSSLYAHLSSIGVQKGQELKTGEVLGYSGMTGYATGPHLHFGLYASEALQITTLANYRSATTPCANAKIPVAPRNAYLNPMSYF